MRNIELLPAERGLAIDVAASITNTLLASGLYTADQLNLVFDRLVDVLEKESVGDLMDLLPRDVFPQEDQ